MGRELPKDSEESDAEWKNNSLIQVLEEFEKGNEVHILQVIKFIREYNSTHSQMYTDDEIIEQIKCKIQIDEDSEYLNANQFMEYLAGEIQVETEEEILKAFRVFDNENTGKIALSELKSIMEGQGIPLNDEELITFMTKFKHDFEYVNVVKGAKDIKPIKYEKDVKPVKPEKAVKLANRVKDVKVVEVVEVVRGLKCVKHVKDVQVDYREFVQTIMEKISVQGTTLWECKD